MAEPEPTPTDVDPNESPFAVPGVEGLPFPRDGIEAQVIREILSESERADT